MCIMLHNFTGAKLSYVNTKSDSKFYAKPVAVPSNVFTIKENDVSIGSVTRRVSVATSSLSGTVIFVTL